MHDKNLAFPMGQYAIAKKEDDVTLETPKVQTCVALVLTSPVGIAMAHFDTPFFIRETTNRLVNQLKSYGTETNSIHATIIGGDAKILFGSSTIYNTLYDELNEQQIKFTHNDFYSSNPYMFLPTLLYTFINFMRFIGHESWVGFLLCLSLFLAAEFYISPIKSSDVSVNSATNTITTVKNSIRHSKEIESRFSPSQMTFYKERLKIGPLDKSKKELPVSRYLVKNFRLLSKIHSITRPLFLLPRSSRFRSLCSRTNCFTE